ncbi:MAG: hypothetical protein QOI41_7242 [Myxococcales bacterium]|nr:hypothetical protein [Myxococcales bacterium]
MSSARNSDVSHASHASHATRVWRSLGGRLALWYVVVTLASFLAVAVVHAARTDAWAAREGQRGAETALERYRRALESGGTGALSTMLGSAPEDQRAAIRLTDERNVALLVIASDDDSGRAAATLHQHGELAASRATPRDWSVAVARVSQGRRLEVVVPNVVGPRLREHEREELWLIMAIGLATAVAGAFALSRQALRPLGDLAHATESIIASGDLSLRVPERGADDLDELVRLFNQMLARNEALVRAMKQSLDDVAHDLRTPLTRLRTGAELALRGPVDAERASEALADVVEESDRVLAMLTTLMDITEAETGSMRLERRPEDLASIVREAVELYEHVSSERGVHVVTRLSHVVMVMVDRQRILQAIANLLDNAIKYTPAGGSVAVSVSSSATHGIVTISDTGIGIAPEDQTLVWDRLFRGDRSRSERGLGLGLSLVKAIVEAHDGEVELRSTVGEGSTFVIRLPRSS